MTEIQPIDYPKYLEAAIGSWWYFLTLLLPGLVFLVPAITRWRYILWLVPLAFLASCFGYLVYWRSIDWALMDYYRRTGYLNSSDTWYSFMPLFRGVPNAIAATLGCAAAGWMVSQRGPTNASLVRTPAATRMQETSSTRPINPYQSPHDASHEA